MRKIPRRNVPDRQPDATKANEKKIKQRKNYVTVACVFLYTILQHPGNHFFFNFDLLEHHGAPDTNSAAVVGQVHPVMR